MLLELFTSEGCSSCPAADRLLAQLDRDQPIAGADLIVASEHVDYWNRLGWTDPFSSSLFSRRQQDYAAKLAVSDVYTPQLVVDGHAELVGSLRKEATEAIERSLREPKAPIVVTASRNKAEVVVHIGAKSFAKRQTANLFVMLARNSVASNVRSGENNGRRLAHVAVVQMIRPAGTWNMGEALDRKLSLKPSEPASPGETRVIAFAQDPKTGRVLAVAPSKL